MPDVSPRLLQAESEFSRFYFESAVQPLQGQPAHQLLMALAIFPKPPVQDAICAVAQVNDRIAADGLARLQQLSLIQHEQGRYQMFPLTRSYTLAELTAHPKFEQQARNRWINWYLAFVREPSGKDWQKWKDCQGLEQEWENIAEVMEWCISRDRYTDACQLWRDVKYYVYSQAYQCNDLTCWQASLNWLNWLIQAAQARQDWSTVEEIMNDRAGKSNLIEQSKHIVLS